MEATELLETTILPLGNIKASFIEVCKYIFLVFSGGLREGENRLVLMPQWLQRKLLLQTPLGVGCKSLCVRWDT